MEGGGGRRGRARGWRASTAKFQQRHVAKCTRNVATSPTCSGHLSIDRGGMHFLRRLFQSEDTAEIHERLDKLEKNDRNREVEWTEVYSKFRTLQMRVAKQVQRLDANSSQEETTGGEGEETTTSGLGAGSSLSPRQAKLQREIMARRNKQFAQKEE